MGAPCRLLSDLLEIYYDKWFSYDLTADANYALARIVLW